MNNPNDFHAPNNKGGVGSSHQGTSTSYNDFYGSTPLTNVQGNDGNQQTEIQQSFMVGSQPQQQAIPFYHLTTQQHAMGLSTVNPIGVTPFVAPTPPNNVILPLPNQPTFYAYNMQQQAGTGNLTMNVNPCTVGTNNPFMLPSSAVANPLLAFNASQFIGRNVQWQAVGHSTMNTTISNSTSIIDTRDSAKKEMMDLPDDDDDRMQSVRDRNRVHARSARQRKKAYVHQLKSLVENLHTERTEEMRKRMVAVQRNVDIQKVRRRVMVTFLNYHSRYQTDVRKWSSILEETFWLKQPITPFRSFRRSEIENECRISRGLEAVINDAASLSVMLESIGCFSSRWLRLKRDKFLRLEELKRCPGKKKPSCIERQESRLQHAVSSLTCSSESLNHQKEEEDHSVIKNQHNTTMSKDSNSNTNKVSSSSGGSGGSGSDGGSNGSNELQNFHTKQPQDPKHPEGTLNRSDSRHTDESPGDDSSDVSFTGPGKRPISSDLSSSEYDSDLPLSLKRLKSDRTGNIAGTINLPTSISSNGEVTHPSRLTSARLNEISTDRAPIGRQLSQQPSRAIKMEGEAPDRPHLIATDAGDGSSDSDDSMSPQIQGQYHFNDDDIMIMDDVSMCPFVFRSHNAVLCGAMAECVMPGMLRARFSDRNKLLSVELVYDAMGFMQQLERASGNDVTTQIIPGSLDMALSPTNQEARVITLAHPPYMIVNVNEVWTRVTGYAQVESEGVGYLQLLEGDATVGDAKQRPGKPVHSFDRVAKGQPACSTNIHYDSNGRDFVEFVCSYPLTNSNDEVTHILHVSRELPSFDSQIETSKSNRLQ